MPMVTGQTYGNWRKYTSKYHFPHLKDTSILLENSF